MPLNFKPDEIQADAVERGRWISDDELQSMKRRARLTLDMFNELPAVQRALIRGRVEQALQLAEQITKL